MLGFKERCEILGISHWDVIAQMQPVEIVEIEGQYYDRWDVEEKIQELKDAMDFFYDVG